MTTITPADSTTTRGLTRSVRTALTGLAAAGAGICIAVGHWFTVDPGLPASTYLHQLAAHHGTGVVGGLTTSVGAFLLVPGLVGLLSLVRGPGAGLATAGGILAGCGAVALGAGDVMITLVMGGLIQNHPDTARQVFDATATEPLMSLPFVFAPLLVLGLVLVGASLLRARTVPRAEAVLLMIGALLIIPSTGGGMVAAVALTPLGCALVLLGGRTMKARP